MKQIMSKVGLFARTVVAFAWLFVRPVFRLFQIVTKPTIGKLFIMFIGAWIAGPWGAVLAASAAMIAPRIKMRNGKAKNAGSSTRGSQRTDRRADTTGHSPAADRNEDRKAA